MAVYVAVLEVPISKQGLVRPLNAAGVNGADFLILIVLTTVAPHTLAIETVIVPVVKVDANFAVAACPLPVSVIKEEDLVQV